MAKLNDAEAETAETQAWLLFAYGCEYITRAQAAALGKKYEQVIGQLVKMMTHPEQWRV